MDYQGLAAGVFIRLEHAFPCRIDWVEAPHALMASGCIINNNNKLVALLSRKREGLPWDPSLVLLSSDTLVAWPERNLILVDSATYF